jgi:hypothetical protein
MTTFDTLQATHPALFERIRRSPTGNGCWFWVGALATNGYGRIWTEGTSRYAHRVVFELAHGVVLDSHQVLAHRCDEASCVRPDHLEVGDQASNLADAGRKGRLGKARAAALDPRRARGRAQAIRAALEAGWDDTRLADALAAGAPIQPPLPYMALQHRITHAERRYEPEELTL